MVQPFSKRGGRGGGQTPFRHILNKIVHAACSQLCQRKCASDWYSMYRYATSAVRGCPYLYISLVVHPWTLQSFQYNAVDIEMLGIGSRNEAIYLYVHLPACLHSSHKNYFVLCFFYIFLVPYILLLMHSSVVLMLLFRAVYRRESYSVSAQTNVFACCTGYTTCGPTATSCCPSKSASLWNSVIDTLP